MPGAIQFSLGNTKLPKWPASQFFLCFSWILVITMIATYSGNLIAFMAVKKIKVPVNTLEELASSDYQAGTKLGSAQHLLFQVFPFRLLAGMVQTRKVTNEVHANITNFRCPYKSMSIVI